MIFYDQGGITLRLGHVIDELRAMPAGSVQVCVTSPPYFNLRSYGTEDQVWGGVEGCQHKWAEHQQYKDSPTRTGNEGLGFDDASVTRTQRWTTSAFCARCGAWRGSLGLEPTPELFITHLVKVFQEVKRVLRDDGTCWVNCGDSYGGGSGGNATRSVKQQSNRGTQIEPRHGNMPKQLLGIPWRLAFALQADGWYLRSEIVGIKVAPMPESVIDRPTSATEKVFLFSKQARYYYDQQAVREPATMKPQNRYTDGRGSKDIGYSAHRKATGMTEATTRNMRNWFLWYPDSFDLELCTECKAVYVAAQYKRLALHVDEEGGEHRVCRCGRWDCWLSHFATYPERLVEPCILAGSSAKGACAACGAPWRRVVETQFVPQDDVRDPAKLAKASSKGMDRSNNWGMVPRGTNQVITTGWTPTCTCGAPEGMRPDDLEIIDSPTGGRGETDPTLFTGRKGLNRPRGENEGQRPITRYEQRRYVEQLRNSPHRDTLEIEAGPAFAHYIRTDRTGARPIPEELLEGWIARGLVASVEVPTWEPPPVVPCVILDPFVGSGTTMVVAQKLARHGVGVDLNADYLRLVVARLPRQQAMVLDL